MMTTYRTWDESYAALVSYREKNGTCSVPRSYAGDTALAKWVGRQRTYERKLSAARRQKLLEIGFEFKPVDDDRWDSMFQELKAFRSNNGHVVVPLAHPVLGEWVHNQRQRFRKGLMKAERKRKLLSIDFAWQVKNYPSVRCTETDDKRWKLTYQKLLEFKRLHGHLRVTTGTVRHGDNFLSLSSWMAHQRGLNRSGLLRPDRKELLEEAGMDFDCSGFQLQELWDQRFEELLSYKKRHGDANPVAKGAGLGSWVGHQKDLFRNGDMETSRARRLLSIGFSPSPEYERSWKPRFRELQGVPTSAALDEDPGLKEWSRLQQVLASHNELSQERKQLLEEISWWGRMSNDEEIGSLGGAERSRQNKSKLRIRLSMPK